MVLYGQHDLIVANLSILLKNTTKQWVCTSVLYFETEIHIPSMYVPCPLPTCAEFLIKRIVSLGQVMFLLGTHELHAGVLIAI